MDRVAVLAEECLAEPDPWDAIERFFIAIVEQQASDRGAFDALKEECMTSPALAGRRRRTMGLMTALLRRAQDAGVVRTDITPTDLGMLAHAASAVAEVAIPGLREDLWRRYLGVILDGIRPDGATKLRPAAPPRRLFEA